MNRHIERLVEVAPYTTISSEGRLFTQQNMAEFARLIVRECAQVCRDQPNHYALKADRDNCAIAIEEHFGVEE
jgi:hypothetical protein